MSMAVAGQLFGQLVDLLAFYTAFPIDNNTAQALGEQDVQQRHYDKVKIVSGVLNAVSSMAAPAMQTPLNAVCATASGARAAQESCGAVAVG
jgi:Intron-binding protein aquarius N-terminus